MNTQKMAHHPEIVIQSQDDARVTHIAAQMLANAGYDIVPADSIGAACDRAATGRTELLILTGDHHEMSCALDRLATLPSAQRPRNIAILSDDADHGDTLLNRKLPGTKIHLFLTPLQAYGLLNIVRRIRTRAAHAN